MRPEVNDGMIRSILDIHAMIHGFIAASVEDVPESRMTEQPGGIVNHPAWTLSHLNAYAGVLLALLDDPGATLAAAEAETARFGYGTTPVADPTCYAAKDALLREFRARTARLAAAVAAKHAEYFARQAPERYRHHCPTIGHLAITLLIAHPPHHLGQLRQWRRAAGLADKA